MPKTSLFRPSFRLLLPAAVLLLSLVAPAHGQWYQESSIDISGLDFRLNVFGSISSGMDLAFAGDTVVVGGGRDAYIFDRNSAGQWTQTATFKVVPASATMNLFPVQVAIDGDNVAVSSHSSLASYILHRSALGTWNSTSLVGGAMDIDISGDTALLCYEAGWNLGLGQRIFDRQSDGSWTQSFVISQLGSTDFGNTGSIFGDRILIGDNKKAYVFERDSTGTWFSTATLDTMMNGGFGYGVDLSDSTAIVGGWPQHMYVQDDSGAWIQTPKLPGEGGGLVSIDGGNAIIMTSTGGSSIACALRRDANGNWTESQSLGKLISTVNFSQPIAAGGGKLAVAGQDGQLRVYAYDSSPRLFYSSFNYGTKLADLGLTSHSTSLYGSAQIDGYDRLSLSCPGAGSTGVSKTLDCDEQVTFTFTYDSLQTNGRLELMLGGVVLDTITSSGTYRRTFTLADLGLTPGPLEWKLDCTGTSYSSAAVDDLFITTIPEPATLSLLGLGVLGLRRRR